ncbi:TonB family protein [bacterium]|nr:TonB family protein [bacterium]
MGQRFLLLILFFLPLVAFGQTDCSSIDYMGYSYPLAQVGTQCWFAEDLRTGFFKDGSPIGGLGNALLEAESDGYAQSVFYSFDVMSDERGLCPTGWRLPREEDFHYFESAEELKVNSWEGTDSWNLAFEPTGFGDVVDGHRATSAKGILSYHWMSSDERERIGFLRQLFSAKARLKAFQLKNGASAFGLASGSSELYFERLNRGYALSIRCVKDLDVQPGLVQLEAETTDFGDSELPVSIISPGDDIPVVGAFKMPQQKSCNESMNPKRCTEEFIVRYIAQNSIYPKVAATLGVQIQGTVFVYFVVGKDGAVRDAKVVNPIFSAIDAEAYRVVSSLPAFEPGIQDDKRVSVQYTVPISFRPQK